MPPPTLDTLSAELQDVILGHLTRYDHTQCALVNKAWCDLITPHIWRTIAIDTYLPFQKFKTPEAQAALTRNAWMVHCLNTRYSGVLELFACPVPSDADVDTFTFKVLCTNLCTLHVQQIFIGEPSPPHPFFAKGPISAPHLSLVRPSTPEAPAPVPENPRITESNLQDAILALVKSNPGLQHLSAGQGAYGKFVSVDREPLLKMLTAEHLPKLEVLNVLVLRDTKPSVVKDLLERCSEHIKSIIIQGAHFQPTPYYHAQAITSDNDYEATDLPARDHVCLDHSALEVLRVGINMKGAQEYMLLNFLQNRRSKRLKGISTGFIDYERHWLSEGIRRALDDPALRLVLQSNLTDSQMACVISREPLWRHIDLSKTETWGPDGFRSKSATALLRHCQQLTFLDISHCREGINSATFQSLLCQATLLVEFRASCNKGHAAGYDPVLLGADVGLLPWGCAKLKIFEGEIGGIPRPDITVNEMGFPTQQVLFEGTVAESHEIQRRVYHQLGAMTDLEELLLGHDDRDWGFREMYWEPDANGENRYNDDKFQLHCLEMSLESGVDALQRLKKLRVLDIRRMAHRVGVRELEWMQEHWPSLESVRGLIHRYYAYEPGVEEWLQEHKPKWARYYSHKQMFDGVPCYRTAVEYP
ncbi:hypothetical protein BGZ93_006312 [Podila epicladia]|nr:hypothetical protein BGZ92_011859 [Podila epicladia]KAG0095108.1 hypothetical protein BGZ93_006312 [Podila epicladia]